LVDHRNLMKELLSQLPYHLFQFQHLYSPYIILVFPLDLNNINNLEVMIPNNFKVKIVNNEITVEITNVRITYMNLYIGKYVKQLQHQQKCNLQQLQYCPRFVIAHGYAFLTGIIN